MTAEEELKIAVKALDDKKAEKITVLKVEDLTILANYFVIASATSTTQVKALTDSVDYHLEQAGVRPKNIEGVRSRNWIVMDYIDVVVHIFTEEAREFYQLERLWSDAAEIDISGMLG